MQTEIKAAAAKYFDDNAKMYRDDYYLDKKEHPKWVRQVSIIKMLTKNVKPSDGKILDIGCGPGLLAMDLATKGYEGFGIDVAENMLTLARDRMREQKIPQTWTFQTGDAENLKFESGSMGCVVASGIIEYMPNDEKMLAEVARVLKPGGVLIINVTNLFGYSTFFADFFDRVKILPGVLPVASALKKITTGSKFGATVLKFRPRKHFIPSFREKLSQHGFSFVEDKYIGFSVFPAPLSTIFSRITGKIDNSLDFLDGLPLRYMGACYLVCARKK